MVATPALARFTALATKRRWRLVLVGDPYQLQAVGRGGLFAELCTTGQCVELQRIHRFEHDWEAAASLKLRRGDRAGWDPYFDHGRIVAGSFDERVATVTAGTRHRAMRPVGERRVLDPPLSLSGVGVKRLAISAMSPDDPASHPSSVRRCAPQHVGRPPTASRICSRAASARPAERRFGSGQGKRRSSS